MAHIDPSRRAIERDELAIELADEDLVVADRDALVVPPAADRGDRAVEVRGVLPEDLAGVDREREHVVGAGAHVRHAVVHDGLREAPEFCGAVPEPRRRGAPDGPRAGATVSRLIVVSGE
jgi:hypothetical protein